MTKLGFQLKGSVVTTVLLEIQILSLEGIIAQLKDKIERVPHFFDQAPIIIDLSKMKQNIPPLDVFELLVNSLTDLGLGVIGWRCNQENKPNWFSKAKVPLLPASKNWHIPVLDSMQDRVGPNVVVKTVVGERLTPQLTKIITKPIRSGQQVYAQKDLIILTQVSAGAEVLADGNIHVYGALRGRALAGVRGDIEARIFCKSMEAELVSIAGNFMLSDALQKIVWKEPAQVLLINDNLDITTL